MAFNPVPFLKDWCSLHLHTLPPLAAGGWQPVSCFSAGNHCSVWFLCWFFFFFFLVMLPLRFQSSPLTSPMRGFPIVQKLLLLHNSLPSRDLCTQILCLPFCLYTLSYLILKRLVFLSGYLRSSVNIQKLFCGSCSTFRSFFDVFMGEKVISLSYFSSIFGAPSKVLSIVLLKTYKLKKHTPTKIMSYYYFEN